MFSLIGMKTTGITVITFTNDASINWFIDISKMDEAKVNRQFPFPPLFNYAKHEG